MTFHAKSAGLMSLALLLLLGCGPKETFVGKWIGENKGLTSPDAEDFVARALRRIELTIRPDGSFSMIEASIPLEGRVRYQDDKAFLKITKRLNKPWVAPNPAADKEIIMERTKAGIVQLWDPGGFSIQPIELKPNP